MGWFILAQLFSTLVSMLSLGRLSDSEKDLEILILRHQLNIWSGSRNGPSNPTELRSYSWLS
jgi:hypothetical protein